MFRIEDAPPDVGGIKVMVDESRDVWFQYVGDRGRDPGTAFKLVWHDRPILLEADLNTEPIEGASRSTRLYRFGSSDIGKLRTGIGPFVFSSEQEKHEAVLLTIEALLIFGIWYDGDRRPDGYRRVAIDIKGEPATSYVLSNFGYPGA